MANLRRRGRQFLRLGLLLFNSFAVICIVLTKQIVRDDLAKPSYHLDEKADYLADFRPLCKGAESTSGDSANDCFTFGLATAPAHVEDQLDDSWLDFARATKPGLNPKTNQSNPLNVPAWHNVPFPEQRVRFWSDPETEIGLAAEAGVKEYRLGVDWGRLVPTEPVKGTEGVLDRQALEHYRGILKRVRAHGMRVMLTLFHHSMPKWAVHYGGWTDKRSIEYFVEFSTIIHRELGDLVDHYVLFNEAQIFATLSYCTGNWPPGRNSTSPGSFLQAVSCGVPKFGRLFAAVDNVIQAHREAYDAMHSMPNARKPVIGIAHFTAVMRPWGLFDAPLAKLGQYINRWYIPDRLRGKLDFIGLNYYGQEIVSGIGPFIAPGIEFSDSGRAIYPDGLYHTLWSFHQRYNTPERTNVRFVVTENGIADDKDVMRPAYMVEHLLAVFAARAEGVPVDGYFHWTLSDNWEWSDGYCPKFGLVRVDRANDFKRLPRPSYDLFKKIAQTGRISHEQRGRAWEHLRAAVERNKTHPFCRAVGPTGNVFAESLHEPVQRRLVDREWRFDKYEPDGLRDFLSVLSRKAYSVFVELKEQTFEFIGNMRTLSGSKNEL